MTEAQQNAIFQAHRSASDIVRDYKSQTMDVANNMIQDIAESLTLNSPLSVTFGESGGAPVIRYDDRVINIQTGSAVSAMGEVYLELETLVHAITAAEIITLRWALGTPKNIAV